MQHVNKFTESIPADYDEFLGPFLFEAYAADLARRLTLAPGSKILETACGTGIATEIIRCAGDERVSIVATDLSEDMLRMARKKCGPFENVEFQPADVTELPFEDSRFDAVVCQFGLMFVPDKLQALREARRVLRPDGQLVFNVWDNLATNPYVQVAQDAIADFFESDPPQFLYLPWSFHDHATIRDLVTDAGFSPPTIDTVTFLAERPTAHEVATGLVRGNPTISDVQDRATGTVDDVVDAVADALGKTFGAAPFRAPMQAIVVTANR